MAQSAVRDLEAPPVVEADVEQVAKESAIKAMSIHQRLFGILSELGKLEKDKHVEIKGKMAYEYISHDAVTAHVRPLCIKYRVMVRPTVKSVRTDGNRTELEVETDFINVDDPKDFITVSSIGYGCDPSDKGPGKAFSYAMKYAYLKLFMLNSADDIELEDVRHDSAVMTASQKEDSERRVVEDMQTWAETFRLALLNAKSVKEVDTLQRANKDNLMKAPEVTRDWFVDSIEKRKRDLAEAAPA